MTDAIGTAAFPGDDISPDGIDTAAASIRRVGTKVASRSATVLTSWHKLTGSYQAPESVDLLAAMNPVKTDAATFGRLLGKAATALETFAEEARVIKAALAIIHTEAKAFTADIKDGVEVQSNVGRGDTYSHTVNWDDDQASVDKNNALIAKVNHQQELLWAAERKCANAIYDLTHHAHVEAASSANHGQGYGVDHIPANTKMPWGSAVTTKEHCGDKVAHSVKHFAWDGVVVGWGGGIIQGVGALVGEHVTSWKVWQWWGHPDGALAKAAWGGLAKTVVGAANANVAGALLAHLPGPVGSYIKDSRHTFGQALKSIVVNDKWGEDNAAAAGETTANVLSLIIPVGVALDGTRAAAAGAEAGTSAARTALRVAGKTLDLTDPAYLALLAARTAFKGAALSVDALRALLTNTARLADAMDLTLDASKLDVIPHVTRGHLDVNQYSGHTNHSEAPPPRPRPHHETHPATAGSDAYAMHNSHSAEGAGPAVTTRDRPVTSDGPPSTPGGHDGAAHDSASVTRESHGPPAAADNLAADQSASRGSNGSSDGSVGDAAHHQDPARHATDPVDGSGGPSRPQQPLAQPPTPDSFDPTDARDYTTGDAHHPGAASHLPEVTYHKGVADSGWDAINRGPHKPWMDYQHQITGIERTAEGKLVEYRVPDRVTGKSVAFDGHVLRGHPPHEVFLDSKRGYAALAFRPNETRSVSMRRSLVDEAYRQLDALPDGAQLEWHVSDRFGASAIRRILDEESLSSLISLIYTPEL